MTMDFIAGFAWPVPLAFASAVAACRFEQGDVLYSDASAYEAWSADWLKAERGPDCSIQVLAPSRSARATTAEDSGKRFHSNWESPVEIELTGGVGEAAEARTTTQGRLFSCLWHGALGLLDEDAKAPEPPALQRDLHGRLREALPALRRRLLADGGAAGRSLYVWVVDQASESSRAKAHAIEAVLAERFGVTRCDLSPAEAELEGAAVFHPALGLRALLVSEADPQPVEAALKALLYTPSEGKADRFALSRHGVLATGEPE